MAAHMPQQENRDHANDTANWDAGLVVLIASENFCLPTCNPADKINEPPYASILPDRGSEQAKSGLAAVFSHNLQFIGKCSQ